MKKKLFCWLLLMTLNASCNGVSIKPPKVKECLISVEDSGDVACICKDQRNDLPAEILPIEACNNYMATSPDDYILLYNFTSDVVSRLEVCLRFPKKCK